MIQKYQFMSERTTSGNGDLYEMMTYLLVILVSAVIMIVWLKRKGRSGKRK